MAINWNKTLPADLFSMDLPKTALERAFELAQSGRCRNLSDVINDLKSERFDTVYIQGAALKKQLQSLIEQAKHSP